MLISAATLFWLLLPDVGRADVLLCSAYLEEFSLFNNLSLVYPLPFCAKTTINQP
jgi:hypothetical protein